MATQNIQQLLLLITSLQIFDQTNKSPQEDVTNISPLNHYSIQLTQDNKKFDDLSRELFNDFSSSYYTGYVTSQLATQKNAFKDYLTKITKDQGCSNSQSKIFINKVMQRCDDFFQNHISSHYTSDTRNNNRWSNKYIQKNANKRQIASVNKVKSHMHL